MSRRTPPAPAEVLKLVRPLIPADRAIEFDNIRDRVRRILATTTQRAEHWLRYAVLSPESDLTLVFTNWQGDVHPVTLHADGQETTTLLEGPEGDGWRVVLNSQGGHRPNPGDRSSPAQARLWIIPSDVLASYREASVALATQRQEEAERQQDARRRAAVIRAAYLEENHGDAVALLRGLCTRAGILHDVLDTQARVHRQTVRAECREEADGTRYAEATITLRDEQINTLAKLLAELGITPADEPECTTI